MFRFTLAVLVAVSFIGCGSDQPGIKDFDETVRKNEARNNLDRKQAREEAAIRAKGQEKIDAARREYEKARDDAAITARSAEIRKEAEKDVANRFNDLLNPKKP